jgi:hypothetical protein
LIYSFLFVLAFIFGVGVYYTNEDSLKGYLALIEAFSLNWIALTIITFYFGGGLVDSIKNNKGR